MNHDEMIFPVYISLVQPGRRTPDHVPERIIDAVAKELAENNPGM